MNEVIASVFNPSLDCSICPVKDNKSSIATIISDDGDLETSYFIAKLAAAHDAKLTIAPTVQHIQNNVQHWQRLEKIYDLDFVNHSWDHPNFASPEMDRPELERQILDSAKFFSSHFSSPTFSFVPPFNQMTEASYQILREGNFIAMRGWRRGFNSLYPQIGGVEPGQWLNLKCKGIGDNDFDLESDLDAMARTPAWLIEMWHNIYLGFPTGYQPISMDAAERHIKMLKKQSSVWLASFNEAVSYLWQRDNVSLRVFLHGSILHLKLLARNPYLPWKKFNSALTVLVKNIPPGEIEPLENIETARRLDNGDLLVNLYPEKHAQLKIVS